jgi:hypothetical protein
LAIIASFAERLRKRRREFRGVEVCGERVVLRCAGAQYFEDLRPLVEVGIAVQQPYVELHQERRVIVELRGFKQLRGDSGERGVARLQILDIAR